jgi:hypothetical protein
VWVSYVNNQDELGINRVFILDTAKITVFNYYSVKLLSSLGYTLLKQVNTLPLGMGLKILNQTGSSFIRRMEWIWVTHCLYLSPEDKL